MAVVLILEVVVAVTFFVTLCAFGDVDIGAGVQECIFAVFEGVVSVAYLDKGPSRKTAAVVVR